MIDIISCLLGFFMGTSVILVWTKNAKVPKKDDDTSKDFLGRVKKAQIIKKKNTIDELLEP